MDALTCIHTRRSIRRFTEESVTDDEIRSLLDAAMIAPSAGNARPWAFVLITDKTLIERIPGINPYAAMATEAPLTILVCGDLQTEKYPGYWVQDCSAAVQNILLAATALGLGSVWTGVFPKEDRVKGFRELCNLPEHVMPLAALVIGRPAVEARRMSRFEDGKIHRNTW